MFKLSHSKKIFSVLLTFVLLASFFIVLIKIPHVRADGNIGTETIGSLSGVSGITVLTGAYDNPDDGNITIKTLKVHFSMESEAYVALYDDNKNLLVQSERENVSANAWHTFDIQDTISDADGFRYAVRTSAGGGVNYSSSPGDTEYIVSFDYGSDFPDPWVGDGNYSWVVLSIYAEYVSGIYDVDAPTFGTIGLNQTIAEADAELSCTVSDSGAGLDYVWFNHNGTGSQVNQTAIDASGSSFTANFSFANPTECVLEVYCYANDTSGNTGVSEAQTFNIYTYTPPANYLHVEGNQLIDENGNIIKRSNINVNTMIDMPSGFWINDAGIYTYGWNETLVSRSLQQMYEWNATGIRLLFTAEWWIDNTDGFQDYVKYIANWCGNHSMTVEFVPWRASNATSLPDGELVWTTPNGYLDSAQDFINMWHDIATELKDYGNVMFDLWNEPNGNSTYAAEYMDAVQKIIWDVRVNCSAYNPIVVQWGYGIGYDFGIGAGVRGDMNWVTDYQLTDIGSNLIMSTHVYASNFYNSSDGFARVLDYDSLKFAFEECGVYDVAENYPVLFGEIGWNVITDNQTAEGEWFENMLKLMTETDVTNGILGFDLWVWRFRPDYYPLFSYSGGFSTDGGMETALPYMYGEVPNSFVTVADWVSPLAQQYNSSSVAFEVSTVGSNDTNVDDHLQIQLYDEGGAVYPENFTSATGSFTGLTNGTYTAAVYAEGDNGAADYETVVFTVAIPDVYTLTVSINSPANTTYTSGIVAYSVSSSGNETGVTYQINAYLNGVAVGSNLTTTSGNFIGLSNGTYTFAVYAVGVHGTEDYETVVFTVLITTSEDAPVLTIVSPFNRTYITSSFSVEITYTGSAALIWYNVKNGSSWVYAANTTYTSATSLSSFANGTYTFYAFAINNEGDSDEETVVFTVGIIANPTLPQVNVDTLWLFLYEGDFLGFAQAILVRTFLSFEAAIAMIIMLFMVPIYLRTKSLLLLSILWILIGSFLVAAVPLASGVGILFIALAVAGLLWRLFRPSGYG